MAHVWTQAQASPGAGVPSVCNVTAPGAVQQVDFSRTAARLLHRPSVLPTPGLPLRVLMGEQADLLLQGQRVVPTQLLRSGFVFRFPELASALADLR